MDFPSQHLLQYRAKLILVGVILFCSSGQILLAQQLYKVKGLSFSGNERFSKQLLMEQISIRTHGFFQRNILRKNSSIYDREILESDIKRLIGFYQNEGFLTVNILEPEVIFNEESKEVSIHIIIREGSPVLVKELIPLFQSEHIFKEEIEMVYRNAEKTFQLEAGRRFRDMELNQDEISLIETFSTFGYPYVIVDYELKLNQATNEVTVIWKINSGPACYFGDIEITGNEHVSTDFISKQISINPGDQFSRRSIDETQKKLFSIGLFRVVIVKTELDESVNNILLSKIELKEAPRWSTRFGVGYGKEDQFRIFNQSRKIGFLGGARRLELLLKHSYLEPYNIDVKFIEPIFFSYRTALEINPYFRKENEPGYIASRKGIRTSLLHQISSYLKGTLAYIYESVSQDTINVSQPPKNIDNNESFYNKSGPVVGFTWDNSAPLFSPDRGYFFLISTKVNGITPDAAFPFVKILLDARRYSRDLRVITAYRLKLGNINSYDEMGFVPVEERYFSGGATSVRGWARHQLGPKDENNKPIGGNSLLEGSFELRFSLFYKFTAITFLDFGNVWENTGVYRLNELRYAIGVGFGVDTPIGPVRLDIGRPVFDDEKQFEFHLNIGQAF
jgi:outer membrane protein insertion porin family